MKVTALAIARAFVESAKSLPEQELSALADAAAALLGTHGLLKDSRTFPALVDRVWRTQEGIAAVTIETRTGDVGPMKKDILSIVEHALRRKCVLEERANPALLGGLILSVEDERFDASLRGALTTLSARITQPVS
ncbi:MAG: F0F1 ATP synthase subunit delta [Candidatus Peribacteraceae bacterium]|nr:F0F1 ATP synthase subunit delta [Candidatus Peribacteraceae bacterium]